ncbi:hypothetical protein [Nakamurella sp. PAMC28650]|uniref:hypothetical protein n=1 Tax=Nakamurella sp. PAMC28650 TaxID=2762325 RepID=UPI00164D8337|nr:hypothetical protein [Nakamurella sp. PAMC28650]QNK83113.1 hypothetical protein H7F38_10945 [Nakamurella sp. PAMC28650]
MTDLQFDVHGLRTFRVSDDGHLLPVTAVDDSWRGGVCIARCRHRPAHRAPVESCRCGIYTFRTLSVLRGQYAPADLLVAVVALEGQTLAGSRGWRSQAGRVIALWVAPDALSGDLLMTLADNLPGVKIYQDVDEMLALYPDLSVESGTEAGPRSPRAARVRRQARLPLRRNAIRVERLPLYLLLTAALCALFVHAESGTAPTGLMLGFAEVGRFLAAHNQSLVIPLLLIGLSIYARATSSQLATWLSRVVRISIPVIGAGVVAALITGNHVETSPLILTIALLLWSHSRVLLAEICHTDGAGSVLARKIVRARTTRTTSLSSGGRAPGVAYQLRPDHSPRTYPLTIPVHFEPRTA